jgi:putative hydroxymethylpyrimidine transport system substrate-binding protein
VIAGDRDVQRPRDLAGAKVGVTGVPSDDAVLDTILRSDGVSPDAVERVTIGFNAVAALAAGKVDAATAFWNAEGVELRQLGIPTTEFRVDESGAGSYPELLVVTTGERLAEDRASVCAFLEGLGLGYRALGSDPTGALDDLLAENAGLDRDSQMAQLDALIAGNAFSESGLRPTAGIEFTPIPAINWLKFAAANGLVDVRIGSAKQRNRFLAGLNGSFASTCRISPPG